MKLIHHMLLPALLVAILIHEVDGDLLFSARVGDKGPGIFSDTKRQETIPVAKPKILGGSRTDPGDHAWFAVGAGSINDEVILCGASLIDENALLTAAHCAPAFPIGGRVRVGSTWLRGGGVVRTVVAREMHHSYDPDSFHNDAMVLLLDRPVNDITPVRLNDRRSTPSAGQRLTVMGHGQTEEGGEPSSSLQDVDVFAIDTASCKSLYQDVVDLNGSPVVIDGDIFVCAGARQNGAGTCQGDSGGPLVTAEGVQVGIVSGSGRCGVASLPTLFTRVSALIGWIEDAVSFLQEQYDGGNGGGNTYPPGTVGLVFRYDRHPGDISWFFTSMSSGLTTNTGPDSTPGEGEKWNYFFDPFAPGRYAFTVSDSYGDGMDPGSFFEIYVVNQSGQGELKARGDHSFSSEKTVFFTIP